MRRFLSWLGDLLSSIGWLLGIRREVTIENLKKALPTLSPLEILTIARESFSNLGRLYTEMIYLRFASSKSIERVVTLENPAVVESAFAIGKGVIFLGGHLGNWEAAVMGMSLRLHRQLDLVVKNQKGQFSERFIQNLRGRFGNRSVNAGDALKIYRLLKSGGAIVLLGDQASPPDSVRVSFFSREVPTFEGAARLALHTGAPLIFFSCSRTNEGNYVVRYDEIPHNDLFGSSEENITLLTQRHVALLEKKIRERPGLYLWQHKRWKYAD